MEVLPSEDKRDYKDFPALRAKTDKELEDLVIEGKNLHLESSMASMAKRELENRRQKRMVEASNHVETVAKQLQASHKELLTIVDILTFFKKRWLPKQPLWLRIFAFIFGTILLGIALNLIATWIALYKLQWR
jgi:hypothetical protein